MTASFTEQSTAIEPPALPGALGPIAARSSAAIAAAKIIRYGFVFLVQVILMNLLAPADFGVVRYVAVIIGLLGLLNEAGLSTAIVQRKQLERNQLGSVFTLSLAFSMLVYAAVWLVSSPLARFFGEPRLGPMITAAGLALPLGAVTVIHRALLQRHMRFIRLSTVEAVSAVAGAVVSVVLAFMKFGAWSLVWGTVVFHAVSSLCYVIIEPSVQPSTVGIRTAFSLFAFGMGVVVQRLIDFASSNVDYIVIGKLFGAEQLGLYGIAYDIVTLPQMALGVVFASVAMSAFSRVQDDAVRLEQAYLNLTLVVSVLAAPFIVIAGCMAIDVLGAVTILKPSAKWLGAAPYLQILAPVGLLYSFTSYPGTVWVAKGRIDVQIGWAIAMFVTVLAAVLAGASFGIEGVCWALLIRAILLFPAAMIISRRIASISPRRYLLALAPAIVCATAAAAAAMLCIILIPVRSTLGHALRLVIGAAIAGIAYVSLLYIVFRKQWDTFIRLARNLGER